MSEPYRIRIPDDVLKDLKARVRNTRWPDQLEGTGWDYGTDTAYLKQLCAYWADGFDWRAQEDRLNGFHHYRDTIDGLRLHFIHERGRGPNPIPLLTDPASHGAPDAPSFDVGVASLPGYGFSDIPKTRGFAIQAMAQCFTKLMTESLGYKRFALRGSDIGHSVTQQLALAHPDLVIGAHVTGLLRGVPLASSAPPSEAEQKFNQATAAWDAQELAYARMHGTKPQTLAVGLNDSPAGLASWIVEKFRTWGDTKGNVESRFSSPLTTGSRRRAKCANACTRLPAGPRRTRAVTFSNRKSRSSLRTTCAHSSAPCKRANDSWRDRLTARRVKTFFAVRRVARAPMLRA